MKVIKKGNIEFVELDIKYYILKEDLDKYKDYLIDRGYEEEDLDSDSGVVEVLCSDFEGDIGNRDSCIIDEFGDE